MPLTSITPTSTSSARKSITVHETNGSETRTFRCGGATASNTGTSNDAALSATSGSGSSTTTHTTTFINDGTTPLQRKLFAIIAPLMPEGYPHTVSPDYGAYQLWDTLQCLCSAVTGTLSTRAVLMGVGVGQAEATALAGTISWLMRDVSSKLGSVWFAAYYATDLDNDAKRWRFVADLANDTALFLEIFSVHLPQSCFLIAVCVASLFKAICGVSGGSSRASLTQHFSIRHNMADVAAKDGSQETVASLMGMFLGMFVAWLIPETNFYGTLFGYVFFTAMHLYTNYRAVTALVLTHFNRHRARHCVVTYMKEGRVMGCKEANKKESVLLLGAGGEPFSISFGVRASDVMAKLSSISAAEDIIADAVDHIANAEDTSVPASGGASEGYGSHAFVGRRFAVIANTATKHYDVLLGEGSSDEPLWAYFLVCKHYFGTREGGDASALRLLLPPSGTASDDFFDFRSKAIAAGWDLTKLQFRIAEWRVKRQA